MTDSPRLTSESWPTLAPLAEWEDTCTTVHMWTQIVGKIRMQRAPRINHWWGSTLYLTSQGLTTSPIADGNRTFTIDFDFVSHELSVMTSENEQRAFKLEAMSVASFYRQLIDALREINIDVHILGRPVEVAEAIPFAEDLQHASYDAERVHQFWCGLVQADRVFKNFRARFLGKSSPVHFFWGAFDLAVTRFSGRTAPQHPGGVPNTADWVMHEAYSHELSSAGFWPGTGLGEAAFYSYAYPSPPGFSRYRIKPDEAYFHEQLGEFILPYEAVRSAPEPDEMLTSFLESTYEAAAVLANWDRNALER